MKRNEICHRLGKLFYNKKAYMDAVRACIDEGYVGEYPSYKVWQEITFRVVGSDPLFSVFVIRKDKGE